MSNNDSTMIVQDLWNSFAGSDTHGMCLFGRLSSQHSSSQQFLRGSADVKWAMDKWTMDYLQVHLLCIIIARLLHVLSVASRWKSWHVLSPLAFAALVFILISEHICLVACLPPPPLSTPSSHQSRQLFDHPLMYISNSTITIIGADKSTSQPYLLEYAMIGIVFFFINEFFHAAFHVLDQWITEDWIHITSNLRQVDHPLRIQELPLSVNITRHGSVSLKFVAILLHIVITATNTVFGNAVLTSTPASPPVPPSSSSPSSPTTTSSFTEPPQVILLLVTVSSGFLCTFNLVMFEWKRRFLPCMHTYRIIRFMIALLSGSVDFYLLNCLRLFQQQWSFAEGPQIALPRQLLWFVLSFCLASIGLGMIIGIFGWRLWTKSNAALHLQQAPLIETNLG
jgi:hypothetical protein